MVAVSLSLVSWPLGRKPPGSTPSRNTENNISSHPTHTFSWILEGPPLGYGSLVWPQHFCFISHNALELLHDWGKRERFDPSTRIALKVGRESPFKVKVGQEPPCKVKIGGETIMQSKSRRRTIMQTESRRRTIMQSETAINEAIYGGPELRPLGHKWVEKGHMEIQGKSRPTQPGFRYSFADIWRPSRLS